MKEIVEAAVKTLITKATMAGNTLDAMQFTQAAVNIANAYAVITRS